MDEYNEYTSELLRNVILTNEHYDENGLLSDTFFKSELVSATQMLLLKRATKQIENTL